MSKSNSTPKLMLAAIAPLAFLAMITPQSPSSAQEEPKSFSLTQSVNLTATIEAIDKESRIVILEGQEASQ